MKKALYAVLGALLIMSCSNRQEESAYIGPPQLQAPDGVMTPEAMHELGYISDPRMSPDGSTILFIRSWRVSSRTGVLTTVVGLATGGGAAAIAPPDSGDATAGFMAAALARSSSSLSFSSFARIDLDLP